MFILTLQKGHMQEVFLVLSTNYKQFTEAAFAKNMGINTNLQWFILFIIKHAVAKRAIYS